MAVATSALEIPLSGPLGIRFPSPLPNETLVWLSEHNPTLEFEQTSEGHLIVSPPTSSPGNAGELELTTQLVTWNKATGFGVVRGIAGGVLLPKGGEYAPDGFVVARADWDAVPVEGHATTYVPVLPRAIFELLSPSNKISGGFEHKFREKLGDYEKSEVPLVVLLDPESAITKIRRPGRDEETLMVNVVTFPELPGLELDVAAIYAACNEP
jgi:Uma2 family endonuclease